MALVLLRRAYTVIAMSFLSSCTSVIGYPQNPIDTNADLVAFRGLTSPEAIVQYSQETNAERRQQLRDQIVYARLAAFDIAYQQFAADLYRQSNLANISGDLAVLALNGVGATTGGAATKAALAAASAGVVGAKAAIDKDLFYDKALPAILTQMETSRAAQLVVIQKALKLSDAEYPLALALGDLNKYREAGSLPSALSVLTANADAAKASIKSASLAAKFGGASSDTKAPASSRSFRRNSVQAFPPVSATFVRNLP